MRVLALSLWSRGEPWSAKPNDSGARSQGRTQIDKVYLKGVRFDQTSSVRPRSWGYPVSRFSSVVIIVFLVGPLFFAPACQRKAAVDTRAEDERAIRTADASCLKAAQAKDVDRAVFCYADDASWLPPNAPIAKGKEAIRAGWSQLLASPGVAIDWQITKLDISRAGDLAYVLYTYQLTTQGPKGANPITDRGKDMAVWKKQPDASWKIAADTFNSDLPLAAPAKTR